MRIGILAPPWLPVPPPAYGGTESVIDSLARGLVAEGHDVLLWTVGDSSCPVEKASVFPRAQTECMGAALLEIHHVLAGYDAFEAWGAELVHDHTIVGPLVAARHKMPVVTTNHAPFDAAMAALYRTLDRSVALIAISADQASRAVDLPVASTIHHGIDLERYPVGDGRGDELGEYLVFVGRMAPEKGAGMAAAVARRAGMRLLIAAKMHSPAEHLYFARDVQPLLGDDVQYLGEVGFAEKVRLLGGARALLNSISWPEPFGLAMVESLACGTPVIATRVGSVPEIVDDSVTGFVCDDEDEMVKRLADVAGIDREACRESAERRFSSARMVADHIALYERIRMPATAGAAAGEAA